MHSVVRHILAYIRHNIPEPVLMLAFNPKQENISLDEEILNKILYGRVLDDVNLTTGIDKEIVLQHNWLVPVKNEQQYQLLRAGQYGFYNVPLDAREGRAIVKGVRVEYPHHHSGHLNGLYGHYGQYHGSRLATLGRAVLQSHTGTQHYPVPSVIAKGGGLLQLMPSQWHHIDWIVTCKLAFDETFNELPHSAIKPLCQLVSCAVKSFIYVNLVVPIDQGLILHGGEVGVIRDIIGRYEDQEENYQEQLLQFRGGATMSLKKKARILNLMLS